MSTHATSTIPTTFTAEHSVMLLVDHQVGTMHWVGSSDFASMRDRATALARAAKAVGIPLILTSSQEDQAQGPLLAELEEIAPQEFAGRIRRQGVVNALDDPALAAALAATGRKQLIIAGVTNDVCTVYPTFSALRQGYEVQVVADAGGSITKASDDLALARMERAGADVTSTQQVLAELAVDWTLPSGQALGPIMVGLVPAA